MKKLLTMAVLFFLPALPLSAAGVEVTAGVDRTVVENGESLTLTVQISGADGEINVSGIRDFKVVSSGTSRQYSIVNGEMSSEVRYTYTLLPLKTGRLVVPPLPVEIDGKTRYTDMIAVQVGKNGQDRDTGTAADVFAEISVSDKTPYVGQQIVCRLVFYKAASVRIGGNPSLTKAPVFEGFSAEKVDKEKTYTKRIDGRQYRVTELIYILTPQSEGEYQAGPAAITCRVVTSRSRGRRSPSGGFFDDPFFGGGQSLESRRVTASPVSVKVRPLPSYQGDGEFSGLIGEFDIAAGIEKSVLNEGESATLTVTVSGRGNIEEARLNNLDIPDAFKVYCDAPVKNIAVSEAGVSGKKRFPRALVALKPGEYTLGPFSLTYFDVQKQAYVTAGTSPLSLTVKKSAKKGQKPQVFSEEAGKKPGEKRGAEKQAVEFTGKDIFPLKQDLDALDHQGRLSIWWFVFLVGAPFLLYLAAAAVVSRLKKADPDAKIMARRAKAALKRAESGRAETADFLEALYKAMVYAVYARAGRRGESLTYAEAEGLLLQNGCQQEVVAEVRETLEKIEDARYSGKTIGADAARRLVRSVRRMVRRLKP